MMKVLRSVGLRITKRYDLGGHLHCSQYKICIYFWKMNHIVLNRYVHLHLKHLSLFRFKIQRKRVRYFIKWQLITASIGSENCFESIFFKSSPVTVSSKLLIERLYLMISRNKSRLAFMILLLKCVTLNCSITLTSIKLPIKTKCSITITIN